MTTIVPIAYFRVIQVVGLLGMAVIIAPRVIPALRPYGGRLWLGLMIAYFGAALVVLALLFLT